MSTRAAAVLGEALDRGERFEPVVAHGRVSPPIDGDIDVDVEGGEEEGGEEEGGSGETGDFGGCEEEGGGSGETGGGESSTTSTSSGPDMDGGSYESGASGSRANAVPRW